MASKHCRVINVSWTPNDIEWSWCYRQLYRKFGYHRRIVHQHCSTVVQCIFLYHRCKNICTTVFTREWSNYYATPTFTKWHDLMPLTTWCDSCENLLDVLICYGWGGVWLHVWFYLCSGNNSCTLVLSTTGCCSHRCHKLFYAVAFCT